MDCGWLVRGSSESERPGRIDARSRRTGSGPACSARRRCRYGRSRTCRLSAQLHALACHAVGRCTASVARWLVGRTSTHLALKSLAPAVAFPSSGLVEGITEVLATTRQSSFGSLLGCPPLVKPGRSKKKEFPHSGPQPRTRVVSASLQCTHATAHRDAAAPQAPQAQAPHAHQRFNAAAHFLPLPALTSSRRPSPSFASSPRAPSRPSRAAPGQA